MPDLGTVNSRLTDFSLAWASPPPVKQMPKIVTVGPAPLPKPDANLWGQTLGLEQDH
jgi:hypothetical protein